MNQRVKQFLKIFGCFCIAASITLSGCNVKNESNSSYDLTKVTTSDQYPLKTDAVLRYWMPQMAPILAYGNSMNDTYVDDYIKENTGITVQFEHPVYGQEEQAFNIMLNSNDLPDIIEWDFSKYAGGPDKAIADQVIIPLNSYVDKVCPNLSKIYNEHPDYVQQVITEKGYHYQFPFILGDDRLASYRTFVIRKDLLDKAGLDVPETLNEWETVLRAFRDMGISSPLSVRLGNFEMTSFSPFTGCFGFAATFYHDDKSKVKFGPYEAAYGDWVKTMKRWYDEGLLERDFTNGDSKRLGSIVTNGQNGAIFCSIGGEFGSWIPAIPKDSGIHYVPTKIPVKNKGEKPMYGQKNFPVIYCCAISATSKNKELAARFLDYGYSDKGHFMYNFGKEGDSFEYKDGPRGKNIPTYTKKVVDMAENGGLTVAQGLSKYVRSYGSGPFVQDLEYIYQYYPNQSQLDALDLMADQDTLRYKLPALFMTIEDQQRFNDIMTPINTYLSETQTKLISGKIPVSELDTYYSELKRLGIEEAIELEQKAYDRYLSKTIK